MRFTVLDVCAIQVNLMRTINLVGLNRQLVRERIIMILLVVECFQLNGVVFALVVCAGVIKTRLHNLRTNIMNF